MTSSADIPDRPVNPLTAFGVSSAEATAGAEDLADRLRAAADTDEYRLRVRDMIPVEDGGLFAEYEPGPSRSAQP